MKPYEPLSCENPLLDREQRRLKARWSYRLFVANCFLLAVAALSVPFAGPRIYRAFNPSSNRPSAAPKYALQSQYNAATATTVSVVQYVSGPMVVLDTSTYTLRQIPSVSPLALLVGIFGQDVGSPNTVQRFYWMESQGSDKSGKPLYQTLAAELAFEGSREWQYVDKKLPEKRRKELAALLADETSRALALAPAAWKTGKNISTRTPGFPTPSVTSFFTITDLYNNREIKVEPVQTGANPISAASYINTMNRATQNVPYVVSNGALPITGMMRRTNPDPDAEMSLAFSYIVAYLGSFLLWLYYLISFPTRRTGELGSRLVNYTLPQLRVTLVTDCDIAEGLLHAPRRYWLWPVCVFVPAMLIALVVIWARWGMMTAVFSQGAPVSGLITALFAAQMLLGPLKWPLAGWLSFAIAARWSGNALARYASVIVFAFGYPIIIFISSSLTSMAIMLLMGGPASMSGNSNMVIMIYVAIMPFILNLFWLIVTAVLAWLLNRGLGRRIAAFELRGE
ncbi:MAG: hypothetical protein NTX50_02295 [Candidatus Sumerlaeota bacterium]|nr:hypothetical protein [Candidatus Sumerlaeota bacterium]